MAHKLFPHGPLQQLAPNVWQVEGSLDIPGLPRNVPKVPGFRGWLLGLLGSGGEFGVPRIVKFRQVRDKKAVRAVLLELAALPDLRLILVSHGKPVTHDPAGALRKAAEGL